MSIIWKVTTNFLFAFGLVAFLAWSLNHQIHPTITKPVADGSEAALMMKCSPTTGLPGHVVIVPQNKVSVIYTDSPRLIHQALEQVFDNGKTHHVVYGFCK
jgi:hypothetical protein